MANATRIQRFPGFHILSYPGGRVEVFHDKTERKDYGSPVKKESRRGVKWKHYKLNKNGHRHNPHKKR